MIPEFLLAAAVAGLGVALMTGPLGTLVVWRRLAYFGDTLAHGALLGAALGVALELSPRLAVVAASLALALALLALRRGQRLAADTLLGILSHTALAAGLVGVSLLADARLDLYGLLFGDLLTTRWADCAAIWLTAAAVVGLIAWRWEGLLLATLDEDLARAEGVPVARLELLLFALVALTIAFAMQVVGVLLITALLIIPAAAARQLARSPEAMALGAALVGALAVLLGLGLSFGLNTPAGPSIVLMASAIFVLLAAWRGRRTD